MSGSDKVLVYHFRANGDPTVKDGLAVISQQELKEILSKHPDLQSTTKSLRRGATVVQIYQRDLLTAEQRAANADLPNKDANLAGVRLPLSVIVGSALAGLYEEIVILSKKV